jgi:hypothetical protein
MIYVIGELKRARVRLHRGVVESVEGYATGPLSETIFSVVGVKPENLLWVHVSH